MQDDNTTADKDDNTTADHDDNATAFATRLQSCSLHDTTIDQHDDTIDQYDDTSDTDFENTGGMLQSWIREWAHAIFTIIISILYFTSIVRRTSNVRRTFVRLTFRLYVQARGNNDYK